MSRVAETQGYRYGLSRRQRDGASDTGQQVSGLDESEVS